MKRYEGYVSADTTCWITCECGYEIDEIISDSNIEYCPVCGRGYKTEFIVWQYDSKEEYEQKG